MSLRAALSAHKNALRVLGTAIALNCALGGLYGAAMGIGLWNGLYYSTGVATTSGNSPYGPSGWFPHVLTVAMECMVIPLFGASFSLFTSGLSAAHIKLHLRKSAASAEASHRIISDLYLEQTGAAHPDAAT